MSFIQCKSRNEVEKILSERKTGFVTEDHRIYDEVVFSDDQMYYTLTPATLLALYELQSNIEMFGDERSAEMTFLTLEEDAKTLTESFRKVQALIKTNPIKKRTK